MRDDIHKSAPVHRDWQRVLKRCIRDADQERAIDAAQRASHAQLKRETSPPFMTALKKILNEPQLHGLSNPAEQLKMASCGHVLEKQIIDRLAWGLSGGGSLAELTSAIEGALKDRSEADFRQLTGHTMKQSGKGVRECLQNLRAVQARLDHTHMVKVLLNDSVSSKSSDRVTSKVSLDENLLKK